MTNKLVFSEQDDNTIVELPPYKLTNMVLGGDIDQPMLEPHEIKEHNLKIRLAHTGERMGSASLLVQKMYRKIGYDIPEMHLSQDRITLIASQNDAIVGTLTLGIDADSGLLAEQNYKFEIGHLREKGHKVCELTKFAVDQTRGSKRVLAALFHIAYIYGRVLQKQTDVVIEVKPKHASFYKRLLGFEQIGPERLNSRVNTIGVLLLLDINYVEHQIELWGGKTEEAKGERSLYPYFFSKQDEVGITQRLLQYE
jgi:hypothetical protein